KVLLAELGGDATGAQDAGHVRVLKVPGEREPLLNRELRAALQDEAGVRHVDVLTGVGRRRLLGVSVPADAAARVRRNRRTLAEADAADQFQRRDASGDRYAERERLIVEDEGALAGPFEPRQRHLDIRAIADD